MAIDGVVAGPKCNVLMAFIFLGHKIVNLLVIPARGPNQVTILVNNSRLGVCCITRRAMRRQEREIIIQASLITS